MDLLDFQPCALNHHARYLGKDRALQGEPSKVTFSTPWHTVQWSDIYSHSKPHDPFTCALKKADLK